MRSPCSLQLSAGRCRHRLLTGQVERLEHELRQLPQLEVALVSRRLDRVLVHRYVLRAADYEVVEPAERDCLDDPLLARPLDPRLLELRHPDAPPACAATERVVSVTRHLAELAADRLEHPPRSVVDAVVAAEGARVVVGDAVAELPGRRDRAPVEQLE